MAIAVAIASLGFVLRPLIMGELHMTYYRGQLSEAGKYNFMAMTVWLPVFSIIMLFGLATSATTSVQVPFTTCI